MNPRPLRCERNDLPLIYEPFSEKKGNEKENYVKDGFPGEYPVFPYPLETAEFQDLDVLCAGDICESFFHGFGSAFLVSNDYGDDQGL